MKKHICVMGMMLGLVACNSITYIPESMDTKQTVFAVRGGYGMQRSIKEVLRAHGYDVVVGKALELGGDESFDYEKFELPRDVKYAVRVSERREWFNPFWCPLNGFWWWNFNVSIAEQDTGRELMTWRGRGCANSSVRKMDKILSEMERRNDSK